MEMALKTVANKTDHAVYGILAQLPAVTMPISNEKFMQAMQEIKSRQPKLFPELVFSSGDSVPWSRALERILSCLGTSGCLGRSPIDHCWYFHGLKEGFYYIFAREFTRTELEILEQEGRNLAERIAHGELYPEQITL